MSQMSGTASPYNFGGGYGGSSPYSYNAPLNFGSAPNPFSGYGTYGYANQVGGAYQSAYNNALSGNLQNYQNIGGLYNTLQNATGQGYSDLTNQILAGGASVGQAYSQLGQQVQGTISGVNQAQLTANQNAYNQALAQINAQAASSGMNSTVSGSYSLGATQQLSQANTATNAQFAQLEAGYQAQLGSASIGAYQSANQMAASVAQGGLQAQLGLGSQYMGMLGQIQIPYPDASAYGSLIGSSNAYMQSLYPHSSTGGSSGGASSGMQNSGPFAPGGGGSIYGQMSPATGAGGYLTGWGGGWGGAPGSGDVNWMQNPYNLPGGMGQGNTGNDWQNWMQGGGGGGGDYGGGGGF